MKYVKPFRVFSVLFFLCLHPHVKAQLVPDYVALRQRPLQDNYRIGNQQFNQWATISVQRMAADISFSLSASASQLPENGSITVTATLAAPAPTDLLIDVNLSGTARFDIDYLADFSTKGAATVAGGNGQGSNANQLYNPVSAFVDSAGNLFIADQNNHRIQKWSPGASSGTTVAGGNGAGSSANQFNIPVGIFIDRSGNLFIADQYNHRIQKWAPGASSGTTVAGGNGAGSSANQLNNPSAVYVDTAGNVFIADANNHRIQKWAQGASSGITVAGGNNQGSSANQLSVPTGIHVDKSGNLFVADHYNHRIQKWAPGASSGITVAGGTGQGSGANQLNFPAGVFVDANENIFIADQNNHRVQKWSAKSASGITVAGGNGAGTNPYQFNIPAFVFLDQWNNIYVADVSNHRIQRYQIKPQLFIAAGSSTGTLTLDAIDDLSYETSETIFVAAQLNSDASKTSTNTLSITLADNDAPPTVSFEISNTKLWEKSNDSAIITARLSALSVLPATISFAIGGSALKDVEYVLSSNQITIPPDSLTGTLKISINGLDDANVELLDSVVLNVGTLTNCASSTQRLSVYIESDDDPSYTLSAVSAAFHESDSTQITATLSAPSSREVVIDLSASGVAKLFKDYEFGDFPGKGNATTLLGGYGSGPSNLFNPADVFVDASGNVFIADAGNHRIQKLTKGSAEAVTVAGGYGAGSGNLSLNTPEGIFIDLKGNLYIADAGNHRVQRWAPGASVGVTVAGGNGAGGNANQLNYPRAVFVDTSGNLFIADAGNHRIQKWAPRATSGTTVAGGNGPGAAANQLNDPWDLFVSADNTLYIADYRNNRIQQWISNNAVGTTVINTQGNVISLFKDLGENLYYSNANSYWYSNVYKYNLLNKTYSLVAGKEPSFNYYYPENRIFIDLLGNLYTVDRNIHRIQQYHYGPQIIIPAGSISSTISIKGIDDKIYEGDEGIEVSAAAAVNATPAHTNLLALTLKDNETPPVVSFMWDRTRIRENTADSARLTAKLSASSNLPITLNFSVSGSAVQNTEYVLSGTQITIPAGDTTGTLKVYVNNLDDALIEVLDSIVFTVSSVTNASSPQHPSTLFLESDDDPAFSLAVSAAQTTENGSITVTATLATPTGRDLLLDVSLDGTANYTSDYSASFTTRGPVTMSGGNGAGANANQLYNPFGVFVDSSGNIFVADAANHRIQKWAPGATSGITVAGNNIAGSNANQLNYPTGVFVDKSGNLFIADAGNSRIQKWVPGATSGITVAGGNGAGSNANQFSNPASVFVDQSGNLYVADSYNQRIQKWMPGATSGITVATINGLGPNANLMYVDSAGNLYVSEQYSHRVQKWAPGATSGITIGGGNGQGPNANQLSEPAGIFIDALGNLFVADLYNHRIQRWAPGASTGVTVAGGNGSGSNKFQLNAPTCVFLDIKGNIYIAELSNHRIQRYQVNPQILIPAGATTGTIILDAIDDASYEGTETVIADAVIADKPAQKSTNSVQFSIIDDDPAPVVSFEISKTTLRERSNDSAMITARLSALSVLPATIAFEIGGSAVKDVEYILGGTQITIPPGSLTGTLKVNINGLDDAAVELLDSVVFTVKTLTNCSSTTSRMSVYIDSDDDPTYALVATPVTFNESDSTVITVTLSAPTTREVLIDLNATGTAVQSKDFTFGNFRTKGTYKTIRGGYGSGPGNVIAPSDVYVDPLGNVFVADAGNHRVQKLAKDSLNAVTVAGGYGAGSGNLQLNYPEGIFVDTKGNLYIADANNHRIQRWAPGAETGETVAGGNGAGSNANQLNYPRAVFVDTSGNLYIADAGNHRIQRWTPRATTGTTVAGGNGAGSNANQLNDPWDIYVLADATIYIADKGNGRIQQWVANNSSGTTVLNSGPISSVFVDAGLNVYYCYYDYYWSAAAYKINFYTNERTLVAGGYQSPGQLSYPKGIHVDSLGNILIADQGNHRIQRYQFGPQITIPAGSTSAGISIKGIDDSEYEGDEPLFIAPVSAVNATAATHNPVPLTLKDNDAAPMVTFEWDRTRILEHTYDSAVLTARLSSSSFIPTTINFSVGGNAIRNTEYVLSGTQIVIPPGATTGTLKVYVNNLDDATIELLDSIVLSVSSLTNATTAQTPPALYLESDDDPLITGVTTSATQMSENGGSITLTATISAPSSRHVLVDMVLKGTAKYLDDFNVDFPTKGPKTVAGGNGQGSNVNQLNYPTSVFIDKAGNLIVADIYNHRVQKWAPGDTTGVTIAGGNGNGSNANQLYYPQGIFVDSTGAVFVADYYNHRIQKWPLGASSGVTVAGGNGQGSNSNQLSYPTGVFVDNAGNIFIADYTNHRIQKWAPGAASGVTMAGGNGQGSNANQLSYPIGLFVDDMGNIFVADIGNARIQRWAPGAASGATIAGGNGYGSNANQFETPYGIFIDRTGNLYVTDKWNHRIQKWAPGATSGVTVAGGNGQGANASQLNAPTGLFVDSTGNIFVADEGNHRIQKYIYFPPQLKIPAGQTTSSIVFNTINDSSYEENETILVEAAAAQNALLNNNYPKTLTIQDDDAAPKVNFQLSGTTILENATDSLVITAKPAIISGKPITIKFTISGTATRNLEYKLSDTALVIPAGAASGSLFIRTRGLDDATVEPLETIILTISQILNASSDSNKITAYLVSDDDPSFTLATSATSIGENQSFVLSANLNTAASRDAVFELAFGGTAAYGNDYSAGLNPTGTPTTVAGGNGSGSNANQLFNPTSVFVDKSGNIFIADNNNARIQKWVRGTSIGVTVAGGNGWGSNANQFSSAMAVFVDSSGNIFIADNNNARVQKWAPGAATGVTVAGGNGSGSGANQLNDPRGLFVDNSGNIYISDAGNSRIQKWAPGATAGVTVAGGNGYGNGNNQLSNPSGVFIDDYHNIYIADRSNQRIQKWAPGANSGVTVLSNYRTDQSYNNYVNPTHVFLDKSGNIYVTESDYSRVLKWSPELQKGSYIAGNYGWGSGPNQLSYPLSSCLDESGNLYVADYNNHRIQKYQYGLQLTVPAGQTTASLTLNAIDDNIYEGNETIQVTVPYAANARSLVKDTLRVTINDNEAAPKVYLYTSNPTIVEGAAQVQTLNAFVDPVPGKDVTLNFTVTGTATPNSEYTLSGMSITIPAGQQFGSLQVSTNGLNDALIEPLESIIFTISQITNATAPVLADTLFLESDDDPTFTWAISNTQMAESDSVEIRATLNAAASRDALITLNVAGTAAYNTDYSAEFSLKEPSTVAGSNTPGLSSFQLNYPSAVFTDKTGNVYIADAGNHRIQRWAPFATSGVTVAGGNGVGSGYHQLNTPSGVYVDATGNIFIADAGNHRIMKYTPGASSGIIVAGGNGAGITGNKLNNPTGVFVDAAGNVFVADQFNHRIQRWAPGALSGTTVAGGNGPGSATNQLYYPSGIFINATGQILIADNGNHRVQRWNSGATTGVTVAGGNGMGSAANQLNYPNSVYADSLGNVFIADTENQRIQRYLPGATSGITVAGGLVSGTASNQLYGPQGIYVDPLGNLFIADTYNHRIQKYQNGPQLLIPAGQTTGVVKIKGIPDALTEANENAVFSVLSIRNVIQQSVNALTVTIRDGGATTYCTSSGVTSREYINRFAITGVVDTVTGNNNGYGNYKGVNVNLRRNTAYNLSVYPTWINGAARSEVYAIWIDYNGNGLFTDAGEQVFSRAKTTVTPVTGTFTVPTAALLGKTLMRVSMKYNAAPTPCETGFAGEAEDYTVNISDVAALDLQPPTIPTNLSVSNVTSTTVDLKWNSSTDNIKVAKYNIYRDNILWGASTTNTARVSSLSPSTRYSFYIRAVDSSGNASANSNAADTVTAPVSYCPSNGATTLREYINRFQLGSINNTSGPNATGYGNYTGLSTNLVIGSTSNALTIVPGWNGTARSEVYAVWIDFNGNGLFTDAGEQVFTQSKTTLASVSGTIAIPSSVMPRSTRMRVSIKYNAAPTSCEVNFAGEVEDYSVNLVLPAVAKPNMVSRQADERTPGIDYTLYPNPVTVSELRIRMKGVASGDRIRIYDVTGLRVMDRSYSPRVDVSGLANGIYFMEVIVKDKAYRKRFVKN